MITKSKYSTENLKLKKYGITTNKSKKNANFII